jgi:hypothetical protein
MTKRDPGDAHREHARMTERELREALRRATADDGAARERAWRVVQAAHASRPPLPRRRPWRALAAAAAVAAVAAAGAAAASAPDSGVGRWVRGVLGVAEQRTRPALVRLPGGGSLLVAAGRSTWVVAGDGGRRRLGSYAGASWSPHGRFVVAWRGRQLSALDPRGRVRWALAAPSRITIARWGAVDGFRVAYLAGGALHVVNGDGTGNRRYGAADDRVAPAWRPDDAHVLAYVDARDRVCVVAVDSRRRLWRSAPLDRPAELAWSPAGRRLLALTRRGAVLFDRRGQRAAARPVAGRSSLHGAAWAPDGSRVAVVRDRDEVLLLRPAARVHPRVALSGPGRFGPLAWSPDGRTLLVAWPEADQWLFLRPGGGGRPRGVANIAAHFRAGPGRPAFPRAIEWCCARAPR